MDPPLEMGLFDISSLEFYIYVLLEGLRGVGSASLFGSWIYALKMTIALLLWVGSPQLEKVIMA